ncbi:MAG TPA: hypothetical protein VK879_08695 [Candidatus Sulfomarinibacteraceae bacterium]|nr:hypothetical protein [Candidatus Sulfomarinibacteraceae bacterium]
MDHDDELRQQRVNLLQVRQAHMSFEDAAADHNAYHVGEFAALRGGMDLW